MHFYIYTANALLIFGINIAQLTDKANLILKKNK